jgi:hypothetical protein
MRNILTLCIVMLGVAYSWGGTNSAKPVAQSPVKNSIEEWISSNIDPNILHQLFENIDTNEFPEELGALVQALRSRSEMKDQIDALASQIQKSTALLTDKKKSLDELQRKIDLLKLTPKELAILENYNRSVSRKPESLGQWLHTKGFQYDITKDVVMGLIFTVLGLFLGIGWERHKMKAKHKKPET